ncbi:hypothetical protein [Phenylobacterium terrae]|uniref:hypothetical protein n=1 Tax=Phenylobacterium terrae TaxID=2665495 RepID=UPI00366B95D2
MLEAFAGLGLLLVSCAAVVPAAAPRADAAAVVAVYPPWWAAGRTLSAAAAAGPAEPGPAPFAVRVYGPAPAAAERLRPTGAIFFLNADSPLCTGGRT